jgi:site-specific DNA-methyltransferase (adenine-specific)
MDIPFHLEVEDAVLSLERLPGGVAKKRPSDTTVAGFPAERWPSLLYEVMRVLAPGRVCWWVCETSQAFMAARAAERMGFALGAPMVWDRGEQQAVRLGFVLPLTRGRPRSPGAELVAIPRPTADGVWPGELPEGLCQALVEAASAPGELVVDPFCGSGAVGVAAILMGRRYLGGDRCELAVSAARTRLGHAGGHEIERAALVGKAPSAEPETERAGPESVRQLTMFCDAQRPG